MDPTGESPPRRSIHRREVRSVAIDVACNRRGHRFPTNATTATRCRAWPLGADRGGGPVPSSQGKTALASADLQATGMDLFGLGLIAAVGLVWVAWKIRQTSPLLRSPRVRSRRSGSETPLRSKASTRCSSGHLVSRFPIGHSGSSEGSGHTTSGHRLPPVEILCARSPQSERSRSGGIGCPETATTQLTVRVKVCLLVPLLLVAVIVRTLVPALVGVPFRVAVPFPLLV